MKLKVWKRFAAAAMIGVMSAGLLAGCGKGKTETNESGEEIVELVWWQIGDAQKDQEKVLAKVNEYTEEKIGVRVKVNTAGWGDYDQKMQVIINTGDDWDMCFTCSWANNYLQNANNMIALGMVADAPLETFLKEHPQISSIRFCLDNDKPGREATEKLMEKYYELGYEVADSPPPKGYKDYNEWLVKARKEKQCNLYSKNREIP